jgi:outer membrane protein assembly factor BamB
MMTQRRFRLFAALLALGSAPAALGQADPTPTAVSATPAPTVPFRGDSGHTGYTADPMPTPLSLLWRHTTASARGNLSSPIEADGVVYFGSGPNVYAINTSDGTQKWQFPATGAAAAAFGTTPTLADRFLYFGGDDARLYKINAATGAQVWAQKVGGPVRSSPVVEDGIVYFGSADSHLYAVRADTGAQVWAYAAGGSITTSPIISDGQVIFACTDNKIYSVNAATARLNWAQRLASDPSIAPPALANGLLFTGAGDTLYALNERSGTVRWSTRLPSELSNMPTVHGDTVYVATEERRLYALSTVRGQLRWKARLAYPTGAPALLAGTTLLVPAQHGVVHGFDAQTGTLKWQYVVQAAGTATQPLYSSTDINGAPAWADKTLYILSDDGTVSAFQSGAVDTVPPQIAQVSPFPASVVSGVRVPYSASLVDVGTGINPSTVSLSVDGSAIGLAQYDPSRNAINVDLSRDTRGDANRPLADGAHQMLLRAQDWRGNAVSRTWAFIVDNRLNPAVAPPVTATQPDDPNLNPTGPDAGMTGDTSVTGSGGGAGSGGGGARTAAGPGSGPPPPPPIGLPRPVIIGVPTGPTSPAPPTAPTAPTPVPPTGPTAPPPPSSPAPPAAPG